MSGSFYSCAYTYYILYILNIETKKAHPNGWVFFLSMGYKKDIFGTFAYEFEPLQNNISLCDMIYGWHRMIYFHFVKI